MRAPGGGRRQPEGVRGINQDELDLLGLNDGNELFWNGRRVVTKLRLTVPQQLIAVLAVLASLATIATGAQNGAVFLCGRGFVWACPVHSGGAVAPALR